MSQEHSRNTKTPFSLLTIPKPEAHLRWTWQNLSRWKPWISWWFLVSTEDGNLILQITRRTSGRRGSISFWVRIFQNSFLSLHWGLFSWMSSTGASLSLHLSSGSSVLIWLISTHTGSLCEAAVRAPPRPETLSPLHAWKPVNQQRTRWRSKLRRCSETMRRERREITDLPSSSEFVTSPVICTDTPQPDRGAYGVGVSTPTGNPNSPPTQTLSCSAVPAVLLCLRWDGWKHNGGQNELNYT